MLVMNFEETSPFSRRACERDWFKLLVGCQCGKVESAGVTPECSFFVRAISDCFRFNLVE